MSRTKRDCCVILFDCNCKSKEAALQTVMKVCCTKYFSSSKDLMKLILTNTSTTNNKLNDRYGEYDNINECMVAAPTVYNPKYVLDMIEGAEPAVANWIDALKVAINSLRNDFGNIEATITLQLLFITDLNAPVSPYDKKKVQEIIDELNNFDIFLYIVGPDIDVPFRIKTSDDVRSWMNKINLKVDENSENHRIAKQIVTSTSHSVICGHKVGFHLFFAFKNWSGGQPWNVPLSAGSAIQIPAQTMKVLTLGTDCKLISNKRDLKGYIWVNAEDITQEIPSQDIKGGISRHDKFVEILDEKMFQCENPRSFSILCFTNNTNVPEYLMTGDGSYYVLPSGTPEEQECLKVLIDCLAEQEKYVIARRVYSNNAIPKFVVLIPKPDHNPPCFILTELPSADDVKCEYVEKSTSSCLKKEVEEEVKDFLDSLDLDRERFAKKIPLSVSMMQDSSAQKIVNAAADKYLDKVLALDQIDIDYAGGQVPVSASQKLLDMWPDRELGELKDEVKDEDGDEASDDGFEW